MSVGVELTEEEKYARLKASSSYRAPRVRHPAALKKRVTFQACSTTEGASARAERRSGSGKTVVRRGKSAGGTR